jgi:hypothetical protein
MWQQVAFQLFKNYAKHMGLQGVWRKKIKKMKRNKEVKAFFYVHSVTDADREHILGLEKYFQLRQNSAKKQKTMYDFFC